MAHQIKKLTVLIHLATIIILGFAVYGNSLTGQFIYDDMILVKENQIITQPAYLPDIFSQDIGSGYGYRYNFYRPMQVLTYMIDYALWRLNPVGYHFTNILLHLLAATAVYWLINLLFSNPLLSFLASVFFAVHPVNTEVVSYISGRADPLSLLFMLLGIVFFLKGLISPKKIYYALMLLFYMLALLSKEQSLIMPVLLLLCGFILTGKIRLRGLAGISGLTVVYIWLRMTVLKFAPTGSLPVTTLWQRMPGFFVAVREYLRLLFLPFDLHMEYGYKLFHFYEPKAIFGALVLLALLSYAFIKLKSNRLIFLSLAWFLLALLPVSNLFPLNAYMAEHWLYVPSMGFFIILANGLLVLYNQKGFKPVSVALIIGVLFFYSILTVKQNNYWQEPVTFYKRSIKFAPLNLRLYGNLGRIYREAGSYEEAAATYKKALEINPKYAKAYNGLGLVYSRQNKIKEAIELYKKAVEINPQYSDAYYNLANAYLAIGERGKASAAYKKAIEVGR